MKYIFILKPSIWVNIANWFVVPCIAIYIICMFVIPPIAGDWAYVQRVWHNWQSLNVGVLALASSMIAFSISRYNADNKKAREFVAARAFLPEALSELNSYTQSCSPLLIEAWHRANNDKDRCKTSLTNALPNLPLSYKQIFSRCLASSDPDIGEHLAYILTRLQVNHSRLESLVNEFSEESEMSQSTENIMSYIYSLRELMALINRTYEFARGQEDFIAKRLDAGDFSAAYFGLDIPLKKIEDLDGFTERAVARAFIRPIYSTP